MRYLPCFLIVALSGVSSVALGQSTVTGDGSGVAGNVPKYSGAASLTSSAITEVNGSVGIGTTNPAYTLDVVGTAHFQGGQGAAAIFGSGAILDLGSDAYMYATATSGKNVGFTASRDTSNASYASFDLLDAANPATGWSMQIQPGSEALSIVDRAAANQPTVMYFQSGGSVGIGTTIPGADLASLANAPAANTPIFEVSGDIALKQGTGAYVYYSDGTVQSTAWNGTTVGGDYAESIDVLGDRAEYEPGDVIVIDGAETGKFAKSDKAYSRMVAGVYSTKPGLVGRRTTAARPDKAAEVPMAMMGIVPTKVSAENGPIERGDLLVSASKTGYAMKGTDRDRLTGAVIGKALAPMAKGVGVIEVLLALQ